MWNAACRTVVDSRPRAVSAANPPYAASACSHSPSAAQTSAIASNGSTAPVFVVPALAATTHGTSPAARSAATAARSAATESRKSPSAGSTRTLRRGTPAVHAARSTAVCAWSEV